jgi:hypothetical protein
MAALQRQVYFFGINKSFSEMDPVQKGMKRWRLAAAPQEVFFFTNPVKPAPGKCVYQSIKDCISVLHKQVKQMRNNIPYSFLPMLFFLFSLSACMTGHKAREAKLQEWLAEARRPIKVTKHNPYQHFSATQGSHYYTLIDSKGKIYLAQNVRYELPEVIE